jgi:hypothetical protein
MRVENRCLVIASERLPREGWEEAFRRAGVGAADELLLKAVPPNQFDRDEWKW